MRACAWAYIEEEPTEKEEKKKTYNFGDIKTLDDNDDDEGIEMMEDKDYLEMQITAKEALDMIMEDSNTPMYYEDQLSSKM